MQDAFYKEQYDRLKPLVATDGEKSRRELSDLLENAMQQGIARSYVDTALAVINGLIARERFQTPMVLLERAEELGAPRSYGALAYCYANGIEVSRDDEVALKYLRFAVNNDDAYAYAELGLWYAEGRHVEKDTEKGFSLLKTSVDLGNEDALLEISNWYSAGILVPRDTKMALLGYFRLADRGHAYACFKVGSMHAHRDGETHDPEIAYRYYKMGADLDDACAKSGLGDCHARGVSVPRDDEAAVAWYRAGAAGGCAYAMYTLARWHETGRHVPVNLIESVLFLVSAIKREEGYIANGCVNRRGLYPRYLADIINKISIHGSDADLIGALEQAEEIGSPEACVALFKCYYLGVGVQRNVERARGYLRKADRSQFAHFAKILRSTPPLVWPLPVMEILYQAAVGKDASSAIAREISSEHLSGQTALNSALLRIAAAVENGWRLGRASPLLSGNYREFADSISSRTHEAGLIADYAYAAGRMATALGLPDAPGWNAIMMIAEAAASGVRFDGLCRMNAAVGIVYNALTPMGTPMPGVIRQRLEGDPSGFAKFEGVRFSRSAVALIGETSATDQLPMILEEDLDVAIALAFSEDRPIDAWFSLEPHGKKTPEYRGYSRLDLQVFSPSWLASTEAGKSLYHADHLMKSMGMRDGFVSLFDPTISSSLEPGFVVPDIIEELEKARFDDYDGMGARHALTLRSIGYAIEKRLFDKNISIRIADIDIYIDGSYIKYDNIGIADRSVKPNDPSTSVAQWGIIFNDNYELISSMFPVFERVRQVLALFKLVAVTREENLIDARAVRDRARATAKRFHAMSVVPRILAPKPWHRGGCWCEGGVSMKGAEAYRQKLVDPRNLPVGGGPFRLARDLEGLCEKSIALVGQRDARNVFAVKTSAGAAMLVVADNYAGYAQAMKDVRPSHDSSTHDTDHVVGKRTRQAEGMRFVPIASVPGSVNRSHGAAFERSEGPLRIDAAGKIWMSNHQAAKLAGMAANEVSGIRFSRDAAGRDVFKAGLDQTQRANIEKALTFQISEASKALTWLSALQAEFKINS